MVQFRTDPATMPLDQGMVRWSNTASPPVHVADLILPQQDITIRGQSAYGENLSWNIWRVTEDHRPQGSIAEARRVVYAASANLRRNVNGVPTGEPGKTKACVRDRALRGPSHRSRLHLSRHRHCPYRRQRHRVLHWPRGHRSAASAAKLLP